MSPSTVCCRSEPQWICLRGQECRAGFFPSAQGDIDTCSCKWPVRNAMLGMHAPVLWGAWRMALTSVTSMSCDQPSTGMIAPYGPGPHIAVWGRDRRAFGWLVCWLHVTTCYFFSATVCSDKCWSVVFLSCPLIKKHADLFGFFFFFSLLTIDNEGYVQQTNKQNWTLYSNEDKKPCVATVQKYTNRRTFGKRNN